MNKYLNTIVLVPMTTNLKKYPTRVSIKYDKKRMIIAIDQIRIVHKTGAIRIFGSLIKSEIEKCKEMIKETFVD